MGPARARFPSPPPPPLSQEGPEETRRGSPDETEFRFTHLHINHRSGRLKKPAGYNADPPITAKHRLRFLPRVPLKTAPIRPRHQPGKEASSGEKRKKKRGILKSTGERTRTRDDFLSRAFLAPHATWTRPDSFSRRDGNTAAELSQLLVGREIADFAGSFALPWPPKSPTAPFWVPIIAAAAVAAAGCRLRCATPSETSDVDDGCDNRGFVNVGEIYDCCCCC